MFGHAVVFLAIQPKSCQAKLEHANIMTDATPMHSFWRFYRECSQFFQVAGAVRALHGKPCICTVQNFHLHSCTVMPWQN